MLRRFNFTQHNSTALEQMCPCQHRLVLPLLSATHLRASPCLLLLLPHLHTFIFLTLSLTFFFPFSNPSHLIPPISFCVLFKWLGHSRQEETERVQKFAVNELEQ